MFNTTQFYNGVKNAIGWRDFYDSTEIPALNTDLTTTNSGQYFQDYLPFDLDVIKACLPSSLTLDKFLEDVRKAGVTKLANEIKKTKISNFNGRSTLSNYTIFKAGGIPAHDQIAKYNRFVGIELDLVDDIGLKAVLNRLGIQLTTAETDLTLYVFHTDSPTPIQTITIDSNTAGKMSWISEDLEVFQNTTDYSQGAFFIGYYEEDLTGYAIKYNDRTFKGFDVGFCGNCSSLSRNKSKGWKALKRYVDLKPFYITDYGTKGELFDYDKAIYTPDNNYGFNFNLSVKCDLTLFFIQEIDSYLDALGYAVAVETIKRLQMSFQNNFIEDELSENFNLELYGTDSNGVDTIQKNFRDSVNSVMLDTTYLSGVCLPQNSKFVSYGSA